MKISIGELKSQRCIERVIIQSVDLSLYIAFAVSGDTELLITDSDGSSLKTRNLLKMKELLSPLNIESLVLRQQSPYDEMVGQSAVKIDNSLEVSLSTELYAAPSSNRLDRTKAARPSKIQKSLH